MKLGGFEPTTSAICPKKLGTTSIKKILSRALYEQGIRFKLPDGAKRFEYKEAHGMRMFFKRRAQQAMSPLECRVTYGP